MIDVNKALKITKDSKGQTQLMSSSLQRAFLKSKVSSDKLFRQEVKIQKLREETFLALKNSLRDARNKESRGGLLGTALGKSKAFRGQRDEELGRKLFTKLMTLLDTKGSVLGNTWLTPPHGPAMKLKDLCQEERRP